jgi:hypothetical protein
VKRRVTEKVPPRGPPSEVAERLNGAEPFSSAWPSDTP